MRRGLLVTALISTALIGPAPIALRAAQTPAPTPATQAAPPQTPAPQAQTPPATQAAPPPAGQAPQGQPPLLPPIIFKSEINYVEVDAVVVDERGTPVKGLTKDDFQVFEDGKPQTVATFSEVEIPVERGEGLLFETKAIQPDVKSNREGFDGRLYVILLDDYHTGALRSIRVKRTAREFIEKYLGTNDLAAVIHASGRTDASQDFTNDKALLLASVDKFMGRKLRSRTLELLDEYNRTRGLPRAEGERYTDPLDMERGFQARNTLGTLQNLAEFMAGIRGRRKALLMFSEGIDYPIHDIFESRDASAVLDATRDAISAAARANVNFFTIDPRGLVGTPDEEMDLTAPPQDPSLRFNSQGLQDELRLSQDSLRTLAEETGGFAAVSSNDFTSAFNRIVRENSSYYVLAYYPPDAKRDGRFHKISVKVKRPGLRVTARKGYANPKRTEPKKESKKPTSTAAANDPNAVQMSAELREVLNSPLQTSGLSLDVQAVAFKGAGQNASVLLAVEMDGDRLTFAEKDGLFHDTLELTYYPVDSKGKTLSGATNRLELKLRPQTYQVIKRMGVRINSRINLPPGKYQVRVGARETGAGEAGTVFYDVVVPEFTKTRLVMGGIALTAASASNMPTPQQDEQLKGILPGPVMTRREFIALDTLAAYTEVYDNLDPSKPHKVSITTRVLTDDGREVFKTTEERASSELKGQKGEGFGHLAQIPLKDFRPGRYLLRVDATATLKDVEPARRETLFLIRELPPQVRPTGEPR